MNKTVFLKVTFFIGITILSGLCLATQASSSSTLSACLLDDTQPSISAGQLQECLELNKVTLIDVREPAEYRHEHIKDALSIPLATISMETIPVGKPIIVQCLVGKRSEQARKNILALNPSLKVYTLEGGLNAWKDAGFKTIQSSGFFLPLDRQTQCATGLLNVSGVMLGAFVHPGFYALSGFVGIGLIVAGLTGWCGMARLLAIMPWNK